IESESNSTFYCPGQPVSYTVQVEDKDDPPASEDLSSLFVSADYGESDETGAPRGHQEGQETMSGRSLITSHDCQACHTVDTESVGPSYTAVAKRYQDSTDVVSYFTGLIIEGSSGVWG